MFNNMRAKLVTLVCFTTVLSCQGETSDEIQRMRKMVVSAAEEVGAHVQKAAHIYGNFDGEGPWCVHFRELADQMSNSWATSANHLGEIARTDMEMAMVICAWQAMGPKSPNDYLKCLQAAAGLVEQGKLDRELFRYAQSPLLNVPYDTLGYEYRNPVAQDVLNRSKAIFKDMPGRVAQYDRYLSGEAKKALEKHERDLNWWKHPPEETGAAGETVGHGIRINDAHRSLGKKVKEAAESSDGESQPASSKNRTGEFGVFGLGASLLVGALFLLRHRRRRDTTSGRGR